MSRYIWKKVWEKREDPIYAADLLVYDALVKRQTGSGVLDNDTVVSEIVRRHSGDWREHRQRLIVFRTLRYKIFDPVKPVFRVTGDRPRRLPLNGKRTRPPLRRDGKPWGPWPMSSAAYQERTLTDAECASAIGRIERAAKGKATRLQVSEMVQDMLVDILSGKLPLDEIEAKIGAYVAVAGGALLQEHAYHMTTDEIFGERPNAAKGRSQA